MPPAPVIRPSRDEDLQSIVHLFTAAVHALAAGHYSAAQRNAWAPRPPDLAGWQKRLASRQTLIAEIDGRLAGFISYEPGGHIDLLYTSPAFARRGVASVLQEQAEAALAAAGTLKLLAEASLVARPFFESRGFHVVEEQVVQRRGVSFRRYAMGKCLAPPEDCPPPEAAGK